MQPKPKANAYIGILRMEERTFLTFGKNIDDLIVILICFAAIGFVFENYYRRKC